MSTNRFGKTPPTEVAETVPSALESSIPNKTPTRQKVGAAWSNTTQKGDTYFRLKLTVDGKDVYFKMWSNGFKQKDSDPTHIIYMEDPK